jgi:hypothetical protein
MKLKDRNMGLKRNRVAGIALVVMAASAQATHLNLRGMGQVLIYPYYTVNDYFQTNLHIVNTQDAYKIVRIRFHESGHAQDVLDLNLYLSPYDVWTGVVRNVDGHANLISDDKTCTMPMYDQQTPLGNLSTTGLNLSTAYINVEQADVREGYVEVIEVGNIPGELYADMTGNASVGDASDMQVWAGLKHDATGVPGNCDVITMGWTTGAGVGSPTAISGGTGSASPSNWKGNASPAADSNGRGGYADAGATDDYDTAAAGNEYLMPPSGGLYGHAIYLNMVDGSAFVNEATAIENYTTEAQHWLPNDADHFLLPSLASGSVNTSVVAYDDGTVTTSVPWGYTVDATLNDGDNQTPASGTNPWPVAHSLMAVGIVNDFFIDPVYEGATDWVITFPMRKHGIYNGKFSNDCSGDGAETVGKVQPTTAATEGADTCFLDQDQHIVSISVAYDREEFWPMEDVDYFEPGGIPSAPPQITLLTRAVNVMQLGSSGVFYSGNPAYPFTSLFPVGKAGWMMLSFDGGNIVYNTGDASLYTSLDQGNTASFIATDVSGAPDAIDNVPPGGVREESGGSINASGVPVIGFSVQRGTIPSLSAGINFGETINHRPILGTYSVVPD